MKLGFMLSGLTSGIVLLSSIATSSSFKYLYQIKANSYTPKDTIKLYYYKEKLIDQYEKMAFSLKNEYLHQTIKQNISDFNFDDNCVASYVNGVIVLTLGEGRGSLIEGKLRQNSCDNSVIREKIFIFELFK